MVHQNRRIDNDQPARPDGIADAREQFGILVWDRRVNHGHQIPPAAAIFEIPRAAANGGQRNADTARRLFGDGEALGGDVKRGDPPALLSQIDRVPALAGADIEGVARRQVPDGWRRLGARSNGALAML